MAVLGYWAGSLVGRGLQLYLAVGWDYSLLHHWVESLAEIPTCASPHTVFSSQSGQYVCSAAGWTCKLSYMAGQSFRVDQGEDHCLGSLVMLHSWDGLLVWLPA